MNLLLREVRTFFVSLYLTVVLLLLGMVLVFAATLAQVDLGIWAVQQEFFRSWVALWRVGPLVVPLPGGYLVGGLLLINLVAAHVYRFRLSWKKTGIVLTHVGLILLLVGELLTGLWQQEYNMRLNEGETKNYAESYRRTELAIVEVTDPKSDEVVAIPESLLADHETIQHPKLPFRVVAREFYPNASLAVRPSAVGQSVANEPPDPATQGIGLRMLALPQPVTYKQDERNTPAAYVELIGPQGSLGTWMVAAEIDQPQHFDFAGHAWKIALRFKRQYKPFSLTLLKFSHDIYPGTDIPKNFSSRVRLRTTDGRTDREALIYMNNPLRYAGLTYYQSGYDGEHTTILQVVQNPGWLLPYFACGLVAVGLIVQFGIHLVGFFGKRRAGAAGRQPSDPGEAADTSAERRSETVTTTGLRRYARYLPYVVLFAAVASIAMSFLPPRNSGAFDLVGFARLPVLAGGRFKPLDTIARTSLLEIEHHQTFVTPNNRPPTLAESWASFAHHTPLPRDARSLSATEWLLDVCFRPELADTYQVFRIVNPDVISVFDLKPGDGREQKYFSFHQLKPKLSELERQAQLAQPVESGARSPFQRGVLQLYENLLEYQRLQFAFAPPGDDNFLSELLRFQDKLADGVAAVRAKQAGQPHDEALVMEIVGLGQRFQAMAESTNLLVIPPARGSADQDHWQTAGAAFLETFQTGVVSPSALAYAGLGRAWRDQEPEKFNKLVSLFRGDLEKQFAPPLRKSDVEARFNAANIFTSSFSLYAVAFLAAIVSWLVWPRELGRLAFWLILIAWMLATAGILTRMWLEGRPPVTNLYSSALFVGWVAVGLCLILEKTFRNGIGSVAAGVIGFGTLIIADRLSLNGDTLEMMRAVLDSNYWLATHVVVVASGYSATFLAGFLALIYIVRGVFTSSLDKDTASSLTRMVYGIVCFATLFSFAGTVLGGIWADQSWGRFWGWDPKENGALIIVIWNAVILHARWGGMIKQRGLMCAAVFGNIVTSWSWFGTNMLGVGLHSYGFTDAAFWSLSAFVASQLAFIGVGLLPLETWRSFRPTAAAKSEPVATSTPA